MNVRIVAVVMKIIIFECLRECCSSNAQLWKSVCKTWKGAEYGVEVYIKGFAVNINGGRLMYGLKQIR